MADLREWSRLSAHLSRRGVHDTGASITAAEGNDFNKESRQNRRARLSRNKQVQDDSIKSNHSAATVQTTSNNNERGRISVQIKSKTGVTTDRAYSGSKNDDNTRKVNTLPRTHNRSKAMRLIQYDNRSASAAGAEILISDGNQLYVSDNEGNDDHQPLSFSDALSKWRSKETTTIVSTTSNENVSRKRIPSTADGNNQNVLTSDGNNHVNVDRSGNDVMTERDLTDDNDKKCDNRRETNNKQNINDYYNNNRNNKIHNVDHHESQVDRRSTRDRHYKTNNNNNNNNSINQQSVGHYKSEQQNEEHQMKSTFNIGCKVGNIHNDNKKQGQILLSPDTAVDIQSDHPTHSGSDNAQEVEQSKHRRGRNFQSHSQDNDKIIGVVNNRKSTDCLHNLQTNERYTSQKTYESKSQLVQNDTNSKFDSLELKEINDRVELSKGLQRERITLVSEKSILNDAEEITVACLNKKHSNSATYAPTGLFERYSGEEVENESVCVTNDRDLNQVGFVVDRQRNWSTSEDSVESISTGREDIQETDSSCAEEKDKPKKRKLKRQKRDLSSKKGSVIQRRTRQQSQRVDIRTVDSTSDDHGSRSRTSSMELSSYEDNQNIIVTESQLESMSGSAVYNFKRPNTLAYDGNNIPSRRASLADGRHTKHIRSDKLSPGSPQLLQSSSLTSMSASSNQIRPFSGVSRVAKITIPALQKSTLSPQIARRHFSGGESIASSSTGDLSSSRKIAIPTVFSKSIRNNDNTKKTTNYNLIDSDQPLSDGEQERQNRIKKIEDQDLSFTFRRSNTLPKKFASKQQHDESRVKVNPFQLKVTSRHKQTDSGSDTSRNDFSKSDSSSSSDSVRKHHQIKPLPSKQMEITALECIQNNNNNNNNGYAEQLLSQSQQDDSSCSSNTSIKTVKDAVMNYENVQQSIKSSNDMKKVDESTSKSFYANQTTQLMNDLERELEGLEAVNRSKQPQQKHLEPVTCPVLDPPDNFRDQPESNLTDTNNVSLLSPTTNVVTRRKSRPLNLPAGLCRKHDSLTDVSESPTRRASYIKAQRSMVSSMFQSDLPSLSPPLSISDIETDILSDNEVDTIKLLNVQTAVQRKTSLRSRPKLPVLLVDNKHDDDLQSTAETTFESMEQLSSARDSISPSSPCPDQSNPLDTDEDNKQTHGNKSDSANKRRARPALAVLTVLEDIPEEKGQIRTGPKERTGPKDTAEVANRIKKRKAKTQVPPTPGVVPPTDHNLLERPDSCESNRMDMKDDRSETGYFSQSSDLLSASSQLSCDYMSQDSIDTDYSRSDLLKSFSEQQIGDSAMIGDPAARSRSDPMPGNLSEGDARLIADTIKDPDLSVSWASNSEPNLSTDKLNKSQNGTSRDSKKSSSGRSTSSRKSSSATDASEPSTPGLLDSGFDGTFESPTLVIQPSSPVSHKSPSIKSLSSPTSPDSPFPPIRQIKGKHDMRRHVLQNLLETEKSYVQNLSSLVTMYYKPLKRPENGPVIEPSLVDEIFFQIPEILVNHEFFLEQLTDRVGDWHELQVIGDIFVSSFTKCLLMDAYSTFINHYLQARAAIRQGTLLRPTFGKFLEQCCKDHREKLTLQDLMIMPVQRIPRYALILKDMLKHTPVDHPDHGNLQLALGEIKTLADRMNKGEIEADQAEREAEKLRDIEATIENMTDLVSTHRKFIRQDLVAEVKGMITKKDRCIFLFSDLLVCATVRRKNHALRRGSLGLFSGQSATEFNKYKLLWRMRLEDVEIVKNASAHSVPSKRGGNEKQVEKLEEDMSTLRNISSLTDSIATPHPSLDNSVRELMADITKQISERSQVVQPLPSVLTRVELQAQTRDGIEYFLFVFLSAEIKSSWEAYFDDAKQKLAYSKDSFPPEFQFPMPITKTRSGMQFTCAAPCHVSAHGDVACDAIRGEVWVCNSDGYVGQVCLLSMIPDAQPKTCLSVCSARIQCISPVPGARIVPGPQSRKPSVSESRRLPGIPEARSRRKSKIRDTSPLPPLKAKKSMSCESDEDDASHGAESIIAFDSSDDDDGDMNNGYIGGPAVYGGRMSPDGSSLGTVESVEGDLETISNNDPSEYHGNDSSDDDDHSPSEPTRRISMPMGSALSRGSHGYTLKGSLDDLLTNEADDQSTMWLGTEDGSIYVYQSHDAVSMRKSKMKMQLGAAVNAIMYFDNTVFVALASGELCVYKRDPGSGWEVAAPQIIQVAPSGCAISCITIVAGRIWCGCQNSLVLVNAVTLKVETTISVSQDHHRSVYRIASSGLGVWVSLQSSAVVKLYHATTHECLTDIDVAPAVHKMLAGADAIIRQHKAACLRVTALLTCKDLLWIGTSAGVILTNPLPTITVSTQSLRNAPGPSGSPHGHTGHVRFLTVVDVPRNMYEQNFNNNNNESPLKNVTNQDSTAKVKRKSLDSSADNVTLVIGGGDGYEDFRTSATSESVGRDDSTNHLLVWRV